MTYSEKLKDPRWQKKRLGILERDGWKCWVCSDETTTLHVHHLRYSGEPWEAPDEMLLTLCESCHEHDSTERPKFEESLLQTLKEAKFQTNNLLAVQNGIRIGAANYHPEAIADVIEWLLMNDRCFRIVEKCMYDDLREKRKAKELSTDEAEG